MRVRNALVSPPFVMYYLTFLLPGAKALLERHGFTVEVRELRFDGPWADVWLVIGTRPKGG
jgi:hypothetical protein